MKSTMLLNSKSSLRLQASPATSVRGALTVLAVLLVAGGLLVGCDSFSNLTVNCQVGVKNEGAEGVISEESEATTLVAAWEDDRLPGVEQTLVVGGDLTNTYVVQNVGDSGIVLDRPLNASPGERIRVQTDHIAGCQFQNTGRAAASGCVRVHVLRPADERYEGLPLGEEKTFVSEPLCSGNVEPGMRTDPQELSFTDADAQTVAESCVRTVDGKRSFHCQFKIEEVAAP